MDARPIIAVDAMGGDFGSGVLIDGALKAARLARQDGAPLALVLVGDEARLKYADSPMGALEGADALVIVTEWKEFRSPDFAHLAATLKHPVVFDGRNLFEPDTMRTAGLEYHPIGRAAQLS